MDWLLDPLNTISKGLVLLNGELLLAYPVALLLWLLKKQHEVSLVMLLFLWHLSQFHYIHYISLSSVLVLFQCIESRIMVSCLLWNLKFFWMETTQLRGHLKWRVCCQRCSTTWQRTMLSLKAFYLNLAW